MDIMDGFELESIRECGKREVGNNQFWWKM